MGAGDSTPASGLISSPLSHMFNFSANHLFLLTWTEYRTCAVFLMQDRDTQRVSAALGLAPPHKDRLSQLSTKESDVCHEAGQQPLEEAHDRKNFAFRRAASGGHPQRLAAQVAVVG